MELSQNILVCVTQQKTCERLIKKAADLRDSQKSNLFVLHVAKSEWNFLDNAKEGEALEYLFGISKSFGANLTVLRSDDIAEEISNFVKKNDINCLVMGASPDDHKENNFYTKLRGLLGNVDIHVIP